MSQGSGQIRRSIASATYGVLSGERAGYNHAPAGIQAKYLHAADCAIEIMLRRLDRFSKSFAVVAQELDIDPDWFAQPNVALDGLAPRDVLKAPHRDAEWSAMLIQALLDAKVAEHA